MNMLVYHSPSLPMHIAKASIVPMVTFPVVGRGSNHGSSFPRRQARTGGPDVFTLSSKDPNNFRLSPPL